MRTLCMFCFVVNVMLAIWNALHQNTGLLLLNVSSIAVFAWGIGLTR